MIMRLEVDQKFNHASKGSKDSPPPSPHSTCWEAKLTENVLAGSGLINRNAPSVSRPHACFHFKPTSSIALQSAPSSCVCECLCVCFTVIWRHGETCRLLPLLCLTRSPLDHQHRQEKSLKPPMMLSASWTTVTKLNNLLADLDSHHVT